MKTHQDLAYLNWIKSTTENVTVLEKIKSFDGDWPRQFIIRLLYFHHNDLNKEVVNNIKLFLRME